jgi:O-antigen/teichoic acid export membrane protein
LAAGVYGVLAAIAIFVCRDLIQWVAGDEFDEVAVIAAWLCLIPLLHGLAELPPMGLLGLGRNRARVVLGLATSAVALVAYLALVPAGGWRGAVIATYLSETAAIIGGWVLLVRYQRVADHRTRRSALTERTPRSSTTAGLASPPPAH